MKNLLTLIPEVKKTKSGDIISDEGAQLAAWAGWELNGGPDKDPLMTDAIGDAMSCPERPSLLVIRPSPLVLIEVVRLGATILDPARGQRPCHQAHTSATQSP